VLFTVVALPLVFEPAVALPVPPAPITIAHDALEIML
jgi:hypothetical protein